MLLLVIGLVTSFICLLLKGKRGLLFAVFVIFVVMGFQNNVQSDYVAYGENFRDIAKFVRLDTRTMETEPLWAWLMFGFSKIGSYWLFIAFLAAIESTVLYLFIKTYCHEKYFWLAVALFYFTFNMMLLQMFVIRQSLAVAVTTLAFILYDQKQKLLLPVLCFSAAILVHNTSAVFVPFFLFYYWQKTHPEFLSKGEMRFARRNILPLFLTVLFLILYSIRSTFLSNYLAPIAFMFDDETRLTTYFSEDSAYGISNAFNISFLIVIYDAIIVFLVAWYYKYADKSMRVFCWVTIVGSYFNMLFFGLGSIPRILMYFSIINLSVFSKITQTIKKKYGRDLAVVFIVLLVGYAIKTSLPWLLSTQADRFGNYKFIFMP